MNNKIFYTLLAINFLALLLTAQIDFGFLPLIETNIEHQRAERINNFFSNLSLGILTSTFFYILLVVIPDKKRAASVRTLISSRLKTIVNNLNLSVEYLSKKYNLNISALTPESTKNILRLDTKKMGITYEVFNGFDCIPFSKQDTLELEHFNSERALVIRIIEEIERIPNVVYEDYELINILSKLRDSRFYTGTKSYYEAYSSKYNTSVDRFGEGVFEYIQMFQTLSSYVKPNIIKLT